MEKALRRNAILAATAVAMLALPGLAPAESLVPPGNSAATQYTETLPTTGGNVESNSDIDGGRGGPPEKVLGQRTAKALDSKGPEGEAAAELAAQTAPAAEGDGETGEGGGSGGGAASGDGRGGGSGPGSGASGGGSSVGAGEPPVEVSVPAGSSRASEVLARLTGVSSGEMGLWLPLLMLAALVWAALYSWRRRHPTGPPSGTL